MTRCRATGGPPARDDARQNEHSTNKTMPEDQPKTPRAPTVADDTEEQTGRPGDGPVGEAELRVRRALDLMGNQPVRSDPGAGTMKPFGQRPHPSGPLTAPRPLRRFVQDGEVPVTVVRGRRDADAVTGQPVTNRLATAEAAAEAERHARERAEQAHQEALDTIRSLQTRQRHIELARDEALAALKEGAATLESLHEALRSHQDQLAAAQAAMVASERAVRAGVAALRTEQAARTAVEKTLQDALAARAPADRQRRTEPAHGRVAAKPARRKGATAAPKAKVGRPPKEKPVKATRKSRAPSVGKATRKISRKTPTAARPPAKPTRRITTKHQTRKPGRPRGRPAR